MKRLAGAVLIVALAACSKQGPSPAATPPDEPRRSSQSEGGAVPPVAKPPAPASVSDPAAVAAILKQGEEIFFKTCATCHMADGYGVPNMQPQIVGSAWISAADPQPLLSLILRGSVVLGEGANAYSNDMAPQEHLTDTEIAAVASYVRRRFGTPPVEKPVTPAEVAIARKRPGLPQ